MFDCPVAKYVWQVVCCALDIKHSPSSIEDLMGPWFLSFQDKQRNLIMLDEKKNKRTKSTNKHGFYVN
jgi:hypothetical protein